MARDTNYRSLRPDEPYSRDSGSDPYPREGGSGGGRGNDPLAELARLIGQDDPFAASGRHRARAGAAARPASDPYQDQQHGAPDWLSRQRGRDADYRYRDERSDRDAPYDEAGAYDHLRSHDDAQYDAEAPGGAYATEEYYDDGQGQYGEDDYEEPAAERRGGGLKKFVAVVGLALVGTAGFFGLRAWTGTSSGSADPPVIKAEQAPTKFVPASANDNPLSKQIYDRVGDRSAERVVPREEQPLDPQSAVRAIAPVPPQPPASTGSPSFPSSQSASTPAGGEPRKVRTETIRPNQAGGAPASVSPPTRVANASPPPPAAPTRSIAATTPPAAPAAPAPRTTTASLEAGSYVVQVASQRSESDAQASFKSLQQKYPGVLGNYQVMVRR